MTILYGAVQGVAGLKAEALSIHLSKTPKYHLRAGLQYLHQSGNHLQTGSKWAWVGTIDQACAAVPTLPLVAGSGRLKPSHNITRKSSNAHFPIPQRHSLRSPPHHRAPA